MNGLVEIWTDGACSGNPGPGGWGVILRYKGLRKELFGGERHTTNNRMELTAAIRALEELKRPCQLRLTTDSKYVQQGMLSWIHGWRRKNFAGVKNDDLWRKLDVAAARHDIDWQWVRGHAGDPMNELADKLARRGAEAAFLSA
jgi:ribonuclease HI